MFRDATGLSSEQMQMIAAELNLSESVFLLPPQSATNARRVRIFTPKVELPMAGHPTIGAAYVIAEQFALEKSTRLVLEEGIGDVPVQVTVQQGQVVSCEMEQPVAQFGETYESRGHVAKLLSLMEDDFADWPIQSVSTGIPYMMVLVKHVDVLARISFRLDVWQQYFQGQEPFQHVYVFALAEYGVYTTRSRMFAPAMGIAEDAATGSAAGPLAAYVITYGLVHVPISGEVSFVGAQGVEMGRASEIAMRVAIVDGQITRIFVGGPSVVIGQGALYIDVNEM